MTQKLKNVLNSVVTALTNSFLEVVKIATLAVCLAKDQVSQNVQAVKLVRYFMTRESVLKNHVWISIVSQMLQTDQHVKSALTTVDLA
jgi:hypothetical protein